MAEYTNPFLNFDVQKLFADAQLPGINAEAILAFQKKNIEAVVSANQAVVDGVQAVARRQAEIAQESVRELSARFGEVVDGTNVKDPLGRQTDLLKDAVDKTAENMTELSDLVRKSQTEAFEILRRQVADNLDELKQVTSSPAT